MIAHVLPDGTERPVAFASRTLTSSEKNYAQVEKEALSLIFGVKRFHSYLYGRSFTIVLTTSPLPLSSVRKRAFHRSLLPDYKGGLGFCLHITTKLNFVLQETMAMLMVCLACH